MIISIERWSILVVWCGLLGMVLGHQDERQGGHGNEMDKSSSLSPQIYTSRAAGGEGQGDSYYYPTTWPNLDRIVLLNESYKPEYVVGSQGPTDVIGLALCYTTNFMAPDSSNIFYVIPLTFDCEDYPTCLMAAQNTGKANLDINLYDTNTSLSSITKPNSAFFLCFNNADSTPDFNCESYSPYFHISHNFSSRNLRRQDLGLIASEEASLSAFIASFTSSIANYATPTVTISVTATTTILLPSGGKVILPSTTASNIPITTIWNATVTTSPTSPPTSTGTDAANATGTSNASTSNSSGLSLGGKIGIAFGAIILVFLLLLALLLLLRRRRKNTPPNPSRTPENLLLSSSLKNNESRDLSIAEKLNLTDRTDTNTPLTSHGAVTPYDNDDDLPAPGSAFTANTPVPISPRRSQLANTLRSDVGSVGISITSGISRPVSPLGGNNEGITISRENRHERLDERSIFDEEPYTDNINGASAVSDTPGAIVAAQIRSQGSNLDAPKVYKGTLQAPFLSEPGMSAEEVAREEEEERRIDEAIAEAEEERRRVREAMGR
ncbi:1aae3a31-f294-466b-a893-089b6eae6bf4 [Sclerotinia trifoliorum]|uniref:1aae3a31-f294-466b-a893-089b6eae6bf4 n=1 Tax=Sclerotinia trifoliorum TaxID=28548 RepID=A0A8H2VNG7_9HELO|nr:1aae3a31-f294-466b-a893-089b6eae6bf4 [Sclerotinia trifoliorum]